MKKMKQFELLKHEDAKQGLLFVRLRLGESWREEMCCDLFEAFFQNNIHSAGIRISQPSFVTRLRHVWLGFFYLIEGGVLWAGI